uniref:Uncharacterized protein n=1 Tax=Salix viminalis TaxID=40686 RepID=A0A6N2NCW9_SALVM
MTCNSRHHLTTNHTAKTKDNRLLKLSFYFSYNKILSYQLVFIDHLQSCPRMSLEIASERVCYVHCNFCNTILVVNIPCSNNSIELNTVTVRCGHCANLLSLNTGSLLQTAHLQDSHKQNLVYQDLSEGSQSSSAGDKVSALEPSRNEQAGRTVGVHAATGKKQQRTPSAYNRFIKEEIRRIKAKNPEISHREAFSNAAKNWAHLPHTQFGLTLNDTA